MKSIRLKFRPLPNLALVALLFSAQIGAAVHAFEHDLGSPQNKVCSVCITVANLGAADIDSSELRELPRSTPAFLAEYARLPGDRSSTSPNQRGPPASH